MSSHILVVAKFLLYNQYSFIFYFIKFLSERRLKKRDKKNLKTLADKKKK